MSTPTTKYKVTIFGDFYTLISDESEQHITAAAKTVDEFMSDIARQSGISDAKKLAVLVALHFSSELKHLKTRLESRDLAQGHLAEMLDRGLGELSNNKA